MNWIILIIAGLCETGFAFCLGKGNLATGNKAVMWYAAFATLCLLSMAKFSDTPVWNSELNRKMWEYYLHGATEKSLLDLASSQLQNMPATYIETAEFDCLRDEGNEFARIL